MLRFALGFLITAIVMYGVALAILYLTQRSFVFHPDTRAITPQQAGLADFEAVQTGPGLNSWWHPPANADAPIILYFHGNGGALAGRTEIFAEMASWGAGVLAVGYPGYGGNAGAPNERDLHRTAQANYDWLIKQKVQPKQIVITGHSMGTGLAIPLAAQNAAAGLIIESPFTALSDVAQRMFPFFPIQWLIRDPFRSSEHIEKVRMPIVWMHGTADMLIPYAMGETLYSQVKGPKCYLRIDGGDHDHLWNAGVAAFTQRQSFALVQSGGCDGRPVTLVDGKLN